MTAAVAGDPDDSRASGAPAPAIGRRPEVGRAGAVLDASALLALLLGESGADKVRAVLADAAMTTVNVAEVVGHFARAGVVEKDTRALLDALPFARVPFDEDLAYAAGLLLPVTKPAGLSFGDRACLALARRLRVTALTADRGWGPIADAIGIEVETIR
jgi:PIN domain nuclease of toxin-antitoxin system